MKLTKIAEQRMVAHGGESPTRKANARRHVAHAAVERRRALPRSFAVEAVQILIVNQLKSPLNTMFFQLITTSNPFS
jgi:hypothetical protein